MEDIPVVGVEVGEDFFEGLEGAGGFGLFGFGGVGGVEEVLEVGLVGGEFGLVLAEVFEDGAGGVALVAVHIDEGVEVAFGAAIEPVDGAFFVAFEVVGVEVFEEVFTDVFAEGLFDEVEVLLIVLGAEGGLKEGAKLLGDVVGEPVAVEDRDDVLGSRKGGVGSGKWGVVGRGEKFFALWVGEGLVLVGEDEAGLF